MPKPDYHLTTSPGKYQIIWEVDGFSPDQAEELQRHLARDTGADPAATDSSRVLRLPGFSNRKYPEAPIVESRKLANQVYRPGDFPSYPEVDRRQEQIFTDSTASVTTQREPGRLSQSERDWAYARRALSRGEAPEKVVSAITTYRQDKPRPRYYAEHTVQKAAQSLERKSTMGRSDSLAKQR